MHGYPGISESQSLKINLLSASYVSFVASHWRFPENGLHHWRDPQAKELESHEERQHSKGDHQAAQRQSLPKAWRERGSQGQSHASVARCSGLCRFS